MKAAALTLSRYRSRAHAVAIFVWLLFGVVQSFSSTVRTDSIRRELESTLTQQESMITQLEPLERRLERLQNDETSQLTELRSLRARIPKEADEHAVLEALAKQAERCGLEVHEFQPGTTVRQNRFEQLPVTMSAVCSWPALCQFLQEFRNTDRLCSIEECRISVADPMTNQLQVTLTIGVFSSAMSQMASTPQEERR